MAKNQLIEGKQIEDIALQKINSFVENGLSLPDGFNPANSLKKAKFILNDLRTKEGKPVLEACTKESIIQCLLESVTKGLDVSEAQGYFIPRGDKLTFMESIYGRIARAKRASKYYKPVVKFVREGERFEFTNDIETGETKIIAHESSIDTLDNRIIAAYTYVTDNDGRTDIFIMTQRQWLESWKKSPNGCALGKQFPEDMIKRTIIKKATKDLVNGQHRSSFVADSDNSEILVDNQASANALVSSEEEGGGYSEYEEVENNESANNEQSQSHESQESSTEGQQKSNTEEDPF